MKPENLEKLKFLQNNRPFLGREYLTWLWYTSEMRNHIIDVPGYEPFTLYVNDKLVLSSAGGAVREHALKGGTPAYARESKAALRDGKLVSEANFILKQENRMWTWSMKADDLSFRSLRLPAVENTDAGAYFQTRIDATETLIDVHNHLFRHFLSARLSGQFKKETAGLSEWASAAHEKNVAGF